MRHLLALVTSFLLVAGGLAVSASPVLAYTPDNEELTFLALINDYRGQNGLRPLALNMTLGEAADFHSQDMAEHGYFAHTLSDGTDAGTNIYNFGYTGTTWGENIAAGQTTAEAVMQAWMNSPGHRANILNRRFREVGIGVVFGAPSGSWDEAATYATEFGRRR